MTIWIDADACPGPVREVILRAVDRLNLKAEKKPTLTSVSVVTDSAAGARSDYAALSAKAEGVELARDLGYAVHSRPMTRDDVYLADEAFFTGTAAEVTPIRELDGRVLGAGQRGPVTERIQSLFFDVVHGRAPKYSRWLTLV